MGHDCVIKTFAIDRQPQESVSYIIRWLHLLASLVVLRLHIVRGVTFDFGAQNINFTSAWSSCLKQKDSGAGGCFHHFQLAVMLEYRAADLQYQDQKRFSRRNWSLKCGLKRKEGLSKQHCIVLLMCL